jgi:hypothetical protein
MSQDSDADSVSWYYSSMPVVASAVNPNPPKPAVSREEDSCALTVRAKLVSLNGGVVLAVCIVLTSMVLGAYLTNRFGGTQIALFLILTFASWVYLLDSVTERLALVGDAIVRTSALGTRFEIKLDDLSALYLIHEGLNQEIGIESINARYRDGREEKLPLGPSWRRHELEAFLASVEKAMGKKKLLKEVR